MIADQEAFSRFRDATTAILEVSHSEIKRRIEEYRAEAAKNPNRESQRVNGWRRANERSTQANASAFVRLPEQERAAGPVSFSITSRSARHGLGRAASPPARGKISNVVVLRGGATDGISGRQAERIATANTTPILTSNISAPIVR